ncbi:MAG TPA: helix-turn-helix domain-containing protein [Solirubrobacteraceae bacterium]|nr:helix-turn-helix domain-containing protein [Solirubrobacteraceae bacterium]
MQCLLDIDVDLAEELDAQVLRAARAAAVSVTIETEPGRLPVAEWLTCAGAGPGVLVLDGVLAVNVRVAGRIVSELIGTGDLIQPSTHRYEEMLSCDVGCRALLPSRFALLDGAFAKRVRFWPQIEHALLRRAALRHARLNVQRAVAAQPRLEVRLALLLWHLAARWGKVERGGVRLPVPLTHQLLGRLIGAERPSVSHALARLAHAGLVTGQGDAWHLHGHLHDQVASLLECAEGHSEGMLATLGDLRLA